MCGIVGIFQKNVNNYLKISNAINVINHRGPDSKGIWHDELFDEEDCHKSFNPKKYGKTRLAFLVYDQVTKESHQILANKDSDHWNIFFSKFDESQVDKWTEKQDKRREERSKLEKI